MINERNAKILSKDKKLQRYLYKNADFLREEQISFFDAKNALKSEKPLFKYVKEVRKRRQDLTELRCIDALEKRELLKYATLHEIADYVRKTSGWLYADYIRAVMQVGSDLSNKNVLFPLDFKKAHDEYTKLAEKVRQQKEENEKSLVNSLIKKASEHFSFLESYADDKYCVIIAKSKSDLVKEGEALSHCVGRMDYDVKMAGEKSIICFIRQKGCEGVPFITAEVDVEHNILKVLQCYGEHNRHCPEVQDFLTSWMKTANKTFKAMSKNKKNTKEAA